MSGLRRRCRVGHRRPSSSSSSSSPPSAWLPVVLLAVPLAFVTAFVVWPMAVVVARAVAEGGSEGGLWDRSVASAVWFTLWQAFVSTVATLVVALPAAWLFARTRFRGRTVVWSLLVVPFVLPTVVVGAAFTTWPVGAVAPRGTVWAIIAAHVFFNVVVVVRVVGVAWADLGRRPTEAAAVLGATRTQTWWRVTIPLLAPSILAAASVVYLFCATSFGVVLLLGGSRLRTVEVEIYERFRTLDLGAAAALAVAQLLVVMALLWMAARWAARWSVASTPVPAPGGVDAPLRQRAARWAILGVLAVLLGVPVVGLVVRSLRGGDGLTLAFWSGLGERRGVLGAPPLEALGNSLWVATVAAALSMTIGLLGTAGIVGLERRRSARGHRGGQKGAAGFDALLMLPLGASAVTVGVGVYLAWGRDPVDLRGSAVLVVVAQALVALPFVVRVLLPAARAVDRRWREAAGVLGASPWQVLRHVEAPLLARPLAVAAGFAFAVAVGEFGATVVLARPDLPTLPISVARLLGQPGEVNRGTAMAVATMLMVVTAAVVVLADRLGAGTWGRRRD